MSLSLENRLWLSCCLWMALAAGLSGCGYSPKPSASAAVAGMPVPAGTLSPSIIGYAWDQSVPGLRPIVGVSGASSLGAPIFGADKFVSGVTSTRKQYALLTDQGNKVFLALLPSGVPNLLSGGLSPQQQVTLSPTGSAALIYAPDRSSVVLIQGLPQSPQLQTISISPAVAVRQAVVSDTGLVVFAAASQVGAVSVQSLAANGMTTQVATLSALGGLSFLPQSTSVLMADAGQNTVLMASAMPGSAALSQVADAGQGIHLPFLVAASSDGRWATVANQDASFARIDLTAKSPASVAKCSCAPTALIPLSGNNVFLVSDLSAGPLWMFDGDPAVSRIVFVSGLKQSAATAARK